MNAPSKWVEVAPLVAELNRVAQERHAGAQAAYDSSSVGHRRENEQAEHSIAYGLSVAASLVREQAAQCEVAVLAAAAASYEGWRIATNEDDLAPPWRCLKPDEQEKTIARVRRLLCGEVIKPESGDEAAIEVARVLGRPPAKEVSP